jgi:Mg2+-importing ATPase
MKYILMGFSSNFGNMFSMMGASVILPFLPMLPSQVLLNNFLYDTSQLSLPTDEVDSDDIKKPTFWSLPFIRRYVLIIGPISSIFDFLTFGVLLLVFHFGEKQFQTGWFMESIATQVFVIYVIRTKKIPFFQSKPSRALLINTLLAVGIAWIIPYLFIGKYFEFAALPLPVLLIILVMVFIYLLLVQFVKRWFYKKFSNI